MNMNETARNAHERLIPPGRVFILVAAGYACLTVLMTWPMLPRLSGAVAGGGTDDMAMLWNFWWARKSLLDLHINPMYTDYLFYPNRSGLSFHAFIFMNSVLAAPLTYLFSITTLYNLSILASFVLSGIGAFMLCWRYADNVAASFIGGALFAFSPYHTFHMTGNLAMIHWVPFYALFLLRAAEDEGGMILNTALAGVLLGFVYLTDGYYFVFCMLITFVYFLVYPLCMGRIAFAVLASTPFIAPLAITAIMDMRSGLGPMEIAAAKSGVFDNVADLLGFISPNASSPLIGGFSLSGRFTGLDNFAYLGVVPATMAVYGYLKHSNAANKSVLFWAVAAGVFAVLSLGPRLHVLGSDTGVPMPYELLRHIPFFGILRAPARLTLLVTLSISVLGALGAMKLARIKLWLPYAALALALAESMTLPVAMIEIKVPDVYKKIAADKGTGAVLEVPFFVMDGQGYAGTRRNTEAMYYQSIHERRLPSGYLSRVSRDTLYYFARKPLFKSIITLETGVRVPPDMLFEDIAGGATGMVELLALDWIVVHEKDYRGNPNPEARNVLSYLERILPITLVDVDGPVKLFRIKREQREEYTIDLGAAAGEAYIWKGFERMGGLPGGDALVRTTGGEAGLFVNLDPGSEALVSISARLARGGQDSVEVKVILNETHIGFIKSTGVLTEHELRVPDGVAHDGVDRLLFKMPSAGGGGYEGIVVDYIRVGRK